MPLEGHRCFTEASCFMTNDGSLTGDPDVNLDFSSTDGLVYFSSHHKIMVRSIFFVVHPAPRREDEFCAGLILSAGEGIQFRVFDKIGLNLSSIEHANWSYTPTPMRDFSTTHAFMLTDIISFSGGPSADGMRALGVFPHPLLVLTDQVVGMSLKGNFSTANILRAGLHATLNIDRGYFSHMQEKK